MQLFLWAEDVEAELHAELQQTFAGSAVQSVKPGFWKTDFDIVPGRRLPHLVFVRQWLPNFRGVGAESIRSWAGILFEAVAGVLPDDQPWALHVEPHYGTRATHRIGARAWHTARRRGETQADQPSPVGVAIGGGSEAGRHRCALIRKEFVELLRRKRRHLLRQLHREPAAFTEKDSLVQLLLTGPETGFLSVIQAPLPFEQRHLLSPFPKGEVVIPADKTAPSRAFAKLLEAELRMGRTIQAGETCVDLGAAPGSWTYAAIGRGASVLAVDRSPLREDLLRSPQVRFEIGDAFRFQPRQPVDWLLCDVIAEPERTSELLLAWLRRRWCRYFVVTLKLKDASRSVALERLKRELPALTRELYFNRLCANKKEACVFGLAAEEKLCASPK